MEPIKDPPPARWPRGAPSALCALGPLGAPLAARRWGRKGSPLDGIVSSAFALAFAPRLVSAAAAAEK